MGPIGSAIYLDGRNRRRLYVVLEAERDALRLLQADGGELDRWPAGSIRRMPPATGAGVAGGSGVLLGLAGDSRAGLLIQEQALFQTLCRHYPTLTGRPPRRGKQQPWLPWVLGALVSLALLLFVVIPATAPMLAGLVPTSWERRIGMPVAEALTRIMTGQGQPDRCTGPAGQAALDRLVHRLGHGPGTARPDLEVRVIRAEPVNAFALPGGIVILTEGMLRTAGSPDALAGVLAHALGHGEDGHSLIRFMRVAMASTLVTLVTGDGAGAAAFVLATHLLTVGHDQGQERAADRFAARTLAEAGRPLEPLANLFERLAAGADDPAGRQGLVSAHPELQARLAGLRAMSPVGPAAPPLLDKAEWSALVEICRADEPAGRQPPGS